LKADHHATFVDAPGDQAASRDSAGDEAAGDQATNCDSARDKANFAIAAAAVSLM
jgi:hypothetical protein